MELVKSLQSQSWLDDFYLVEGTALALYYGHKESIDIGLFTNTVFDTKFLLDNLITDFSFQLTHVSNQTLKGSVGEVKSGLISHAYPYIGTSFHESGLTMILEQDIIAMKLNAISISGQRSKDYVDTQSYTRKTRSCTK